MSPRPIVSWIAPLLLVSTSIGLASAPARAESPGRKAFVRYCSACHGEDADGKGPVANVLDPQPPSLTKLRPKYGNPLSTKLVTYVMGTTMPRAHGTSDMPVWGRNLAESQGSVSEATATIWSIVRYLDTIQDDS